MLLRPRDRRERGDHRGRVADLERPRRVLSAGFPTCGARSGLTPDNSAPRWGTLRPPPVGGVEGSDSLCSTILLRSYAPLLSRIRAGRELRSMPSEALSRFTQAERRRAVTSPLHRNGVRT